MDIRKIKKLIKLAHESNITKLEISEGNKIIRITRSIPKIPTISKFFPTQKELEAYKYTSHENIHKDTTKNNVIKEHVIRSPMVGILYLTPNINEKPFVSIGQFIKIGDILCIIEAMKIMNQIQSDISGTITSILRENGQPVEFDEPLFIIDKKK